MYVFFFHGFGRLVQGAAGECCSVFGFLFGVSGCVWKPRDQVEVLGFGVEQFPTRSWFLPRLKKNP